MSARRVPKTKIHKILFISNGFCSEFPFSPFKDGCGWIYVLFAELIAFLSKNQFLWEEFIENKYGEFHNNIQVEFRTSLSCNNEHNQLYAGF